MQLLCSYAKLPVLTVARQIDEAKPVKRAETAIPRQVRHRLGRETIDRPCADYQAGSTTREIVERYGISKQSVMRLLQGRGILVRRRDALTTVELSRAQDLYAAGKSAEAVSRIMEKPTSTIYHALRRTGAPARGQREASHLRYGIE